MAEFTGEKPSKLMAGKGIVCLRDKRQAIVDPDFAERVQELVLKGLGVDGGGGDAQALAAHGHRRVVDALNIDVVLLEKVVRELLALGRIAHLCVDTCTTDG